MLELRIGLLVGYFPFNYARLFLPNASRSCGWSWTAPVTIGETSESIITGNCSFGCGNY